MLIVSRKQSEQVLIGDDIRVRVLRIRGNRVQLGLEAPADYPIVRAGPRVTGPPGNGTGGQRNMEAKSRRETDSGLRGESPSFSRALRSFARQVYICTRAIADGQVGDKSPQVDALLGQMDRLRYELRNREPDDVLVRWLDSIEQHLDKLREPVMS